MSKVSEQAVKLEEHAELYLRRGNEAAKRVSDRVHNGMAQMNNKASRARHQLQNLFARLMKQHSQLCEQYPPLRYGTYVLSSLTTFPAMTFVAAMIASLSVFVAMAIGIVGLLQTGVVVAGGFVLLPVLALMVLVTAAVMFVLTLGWLVYRALQCFVISMRDRALGRYYAFHDEVTASMTTRSDPPL